MSFARYGLIFAISVLAACRTLNAQAISDAEKDRLFRAGVSQYEAGHYAEAVAHLEKLVQAAPETFEVHELLGLAYSAQSQDAKANVHLSKAVRLKPNSAEARSNLAASFARIGKFDLALEQFSKALELEPANFKANHNLGEAYVQAGKLAKAIPYLEKAQRINASSYDNGYDLSLAYLLTGQTKEARALVQNLLTTKNTAELHNLVAQIEEKDGNFVAAANEFQAAAHLEPSENNLFDWGGELLLHRTLDPAVLVFEKATKRYPNSARLMVGLGMA